MHTHHLSQFIRSNLAPPVVVPSSRRPSPCWRGRRLKDRAPNPPGHAGTPSHISEVERDPDLDHVLVHLLDVLLEVAAELLDVVVPGGLRHLDR